VKNLFLFLFLSLALFTKGQNYTGTYTVGGAEADFATPKVAIETIGAGILTGPVVLDISAGDYEGQFSIPRITGSSTLNTLTIQSANGDRSSVRLYDNQRDKVLHYVVEFNAASNVIFRNLSVQNTADTHPNDGKVSSHIKIFDGCLNITIENCHLFYASKVLNPRAESLNLSVTQTSGTGATNVRIINNKIEFGGTLINIKGNVGANTAKGIVFNGNEVLNAGWKSFVSVNAAFDSICYNRLETAIEGVNTNHTPMDITTSASGLKMIGNYFRFGGYLGIILENITASTERGLIANNVFIMYEFTSTTFRTDYVFRLLGCQNIDVYNNSILKAGTSDKSIVVEIGGSQIATAAPGSGIKFFNNNVVNANGGYAYYVSATISIDSSDHNNLYTTGPILGRWSGDQNTLSDFQTASGKESNSISTEPMFVSDFDLHTSSANLDSAGKPRESITKDYDGDLRDLTNPDIGADEFDVIQIDLELISTAVTSQLIVGENGTITARLVNLGKQSLNSKSVELSFSVDNGMTWSTPENFSLSGLNAIYDSLDITFTSTFPVAKAQVYNICVRVDSAGLVGDENNLNDEICGTACVQFAGNFTIGIGGDFATFNEAIDLLNCGIINGPVNLIALSGVYEERFSLGPIAGLSAINKLSILSQTLNAEDVIIRASSNETTTDHHVVRFNNLNNVSLKGITIENNGINNYNTALHIANGCDSLIIEDCKFIVDTTTVSSSVCPINVSSLTSVFGFGQNMNNSLIRNNILIGGGFGIKLYGESGDNNTGNSISNNSIYNAFYSSIRTLYHNLDRINNNFCQLRDSASIGAANIRIEDVEKGFSIYNNILLNNGKYGLHISDISIIDTLLVYNNIIAGGFDSTDVNHGLLIENSSNVHAFFNTVVMDVVNDLGAAAYIGDFVSGVNLKNNQFINNFNGFGLQTILPNGIVVSDNNNLYSATGPLAFWVDEHLTIASLRAESGKDLSSVSTNPLFVSTADLHLNSAQAGIFEGGAPITGITTDIDGEIRAAIPTIGADEVFSTIPEINLSVADFKFYKGPIGSPKETPLDKDSIYSVQTTIDNLTNFRYTGVITITLSDGSGLIIENQVSPGINVNSTYVHQFASTYVPTIKGAKQYCVTATAIGDINTGNDINCQNITVEAENPFGIASLPNGFKLYPNPAKDNIYIENLDAFEATSLYNIIGQKFSLNILKNQKVLEIDISFMEKGLYFLEIRNELNTVKIIPVVKF
jgi:hypothetical protein